MFRIGMGHNFGPKCSLGKSLVYIYISNISCKLYKLLGGMVNTYIYLYRWGLFSCV